MLGGLEIKGKLTRSVPPISFFNGTRGRVQEDVILLQSPLVEGIPSCNVKFSQALYDGIRQSSPSSVFPPCRGGKARVHA